MDTITIAMTTAGYGGGFLPRPAAPVRDLLQGTAVSALARGRRVRGLIASAEPDSARELLV